MRRLRYNRTMSDISILKFVQQIFLASTWGEWLAIFLARVCIFLYVPLLIKAWVATPKNRHAAKEALWSAGLALLTSEVLSIMIMRPRPFINNPDVIALIPTPLTSSFPSSHTAISVAISFSLVFVNWRLGLLGFLIALGVMLGRVSAGVHYPSDILAGLIVGLGSSLIVRGGHWLIRRRGMTDKRVT